MLDDDPNEEAQRQFRAQVDEDVANWVSQLDSDVGSGVPPPPQIKVTEVSSQPIELDFIGFGRQDAGTQQGAGGGTGGETPPPTCPNVTFSGISFCTCLEVPDFSHWYDFGSPETLNDVERVTSAAFICSEIYQGCETSFDDSPSVHGIAYFATPCSPENIDFEFDKLITVYIARIAGVYHILAATSPTDPFGPPELIFFYGTTTSLAVPASNEVTCNGAGSTWDNALVNCFFGSPQTFIGAASGGTATLSA